MKMTRSPVSRPGHRRLALLAGAALFLGVAGIQASDAPHLLADTRSDYGVRIHRAILQRLLLDDVAPRSTLSLVEHASGGQQNRLSLSSAVRQIEEFTFNVMRPRDLIAPERVAEHFINAGIRAGIFSPIRAPLIRQQKRGTP